MRNLSVLLGKRIPDNRILLSAQSTILMGGISPSFVEKAIYLPLKLSRTPTRFRTFLKIKLTCFLTFYSHHKTIMRPAQFATQCVAIWKSQVELVHILEIGHAESLAKVVCYLDRVLCQQRGLGIIKREFFQ